MGILRSLAGPAFLDNIKAIKEGRAGYFVEVPAGWSFKFIGNKRYAVFKNDELMGEVYRMENIPGFIDRMLKIDCKNVRVRKISGSQYALYVEGQLLFMGHSPKHCWGWLIEKNAPK